MEIVPLGRDAANAYIRANHRHHGPVVGYKFAIGLESAGELVGVAVVGRPVARMLDDGRTAEVTRLCTDGTPNACSALYAAAWRAAKAMGYRRMVTYILAAEAGTSLRASGWRRAAESAGGTWDRPSRARNDRHPTSPKVRWEVAA